MRIDQIGDVDVVAGGRSVLGGEVRAHHPQLGAQAKRDVVCGVHDAWVQLVGLELEVRTDPAARVSTDDVEVT
eukprot:scaffold24559_cov101-Isochrysis_galbana.AAC.1